VKVGPKAYRFRILNACNDRFLNLQMYFAKSNGQMWNPSDGTLADGNAGEVPMVNADPNAGLPTTWPTDGRDGGVPDPKAVGPNFIQIGSEGGFLPQATELPNTPVGFDYNRRSIVVLNILNKTLYLGPAERADVIVDFSQVPDGSKLILYNDSPAPVPAFDPRYDYYTGNPDQTTTGGAPSTVLGYGPNTRTLMQFQVSSTTPGGMSGFNFARLQTALPAAYAASQPAPIVPQDPYNAAFNANYPSNNFFAIQDTQANFFNGPVNGVTITSPGSGYSSPPLVNITGGGGIGAAASANVSGVVALNITNGGTGYTTTPNVVIAGGGGTGATANAQINGLTSIGVTPGSGYTAVPEVQIVGGGGTGAIGVATINPALGTVTGVTLTNGGSGYTSAPAVLLVGGNGTGATATAVVGTGLVTGLIITNSGTGFAGAPGVTIDPPGGVAHVTALANAVIAAGAVTGINMTTGGTGYSSAPNVSLTGGGGANATGVAVGVNMGMKPKAIQELFEATYGRMNATLGVELPNTTMNIQTTIPYGVVDPPTELVANSDAATPIGSLADGTQIWKITHNGVDTHAIHFHLFNVQLINRVGWDGAIRPPDANEVGWKETVRMNPLEDAIVALRPLSQTGLPWQVPNSHRLLNPAISPGSSMGFTNDDPTNEPAAVTNVTINFGWEYVWHCHLLGHEENDMMRPMSFGGTNPVAPSGLNATQGAVGIVNLAWTDNSMNETNWTIQRSVNATGPWTTIATPASATETTTGTVINFADNTPYTGTPYWYRVVASNVIGDTTAYTPPVAGYPTMSVDSTPSAASGPVTPL